MSIQIEDRYNGLWAELTEPADFVLGDTFRIEQRLQRLHELGFDVEEMDVEEMDVEEMDIDGDPGTGHMRYTPRVVEHGYHRLRLKNLTGLETTENQARRLLSDIRAFGAELQRQRAATSAVTGATFRQLPENVIAVRWLDRQFEPLMAQVPESMFNKLEAADIPPTP